MIDFLYISKAFAEENRLRILHMLREQEVCVCQIVEILKLAPSTVSKHLSILEQARLVESEKRGKWVYYKLPKKPSKQVKDSLKLIYTSTEGSTQIQTDAKLLKKVLKICVEDLCKNKK